MAADVPAVSVVTPTYNRSDQAERLLDALAAVEPPPGGFEVLVVDNGSVDDTSERLRARAATSPFPLRPQRVEVNNGPARARNLGWQEAAAPFVAYIDDDCIPDPGWLVAGVRRLASDPELGVVQGRTRMPPEFDGQVLSAWTVRHDITGPTHHFEGCNIFYRREALAATGGFDEEIGWWGEDAAAGWGVVEAGWLRGFEADAIVTHDVEVRDFAWHAEEQLSRAQPRARRGEAPAVPGRVLLEAVGGAEGDRRAHDRRRGARRVMVVAAGRAGGPPLPLVGPAVGAPAGVLPQRRPHRPVRQRPRRRPSRGERARPDACPLAQ